MRAFTCNTKPYIVGLFLSLVFLFSFMIPVSVVRADVTPPSSGAPVAPSSQAPVAPASQQATQIRNPLRGINSVSQFIERILNALVSIGVPIAVLFIVLAGFRFITAQGNQEKLKEARANFMYVVLGTAIFIGAWALAQLIAKTLQSIGVA